MQILNFDGYINSTSFYLWISYVLSDFSEMQFENELLI